MIDLVNSKTIEHLQNIPGRIEKIKPIITNKTVILDYAHTPDGLETLLKSLVETMNRSEIKGRIILVFGCGGDRDKTKRPVMGKIANQYADLAIVTDDNPRTEVAEVIRQEIMKPMTNRTNRLNNRFELKEIGDRSAAIEFAIKIAEPQDIVIIAGKGHEIGQTIGVNTIKFSDAEEINKWI